MGYISGGTTYLPYSTPCGIPVGPPLKEARGTRGTRGSVGSLFGGPFIFIGEILTYFVGVFLVAVYLL